MKSTYVDGILAYVENGSLSTNWEQMGAVSGRLSSRQPNIQSIPKQPLVLRGESHGEVVTIQARAPFLPKPGSSLLCADFSHVELRLLAHLSEDPALLRLFEDSSAGDIFVSLASKWLGKQELEVTPAERERGKRIVYSIIYGVGNERLSRVLGVSPKEACDVMTAFGKRFQGLSAFTRRIQHCCRNTGYAISLLGRKRWLPQINSPSFQLRAQAERQAVNFTVQGSAADICKLAMVRVFSALQVTPSLNARLIAQIHDELLFEVEDSQIQNLKEVVTSTMTSLQHLEMWNVSLKVPLPIHSSWGKSWAHLEGEEEAPLHVQQRSSTDLINEGS
uniref:DNA-directed DNA polymerase family A palm domain-containing protein n=1 Tax=Eptatretus burgeri TaxID=7764 RepID=A0A8C4N1U9_EPTBU